MHTIAILPRLAVTSLAIALAGCAGTDERDELVSQGRVGTDCFNISQVRDFRHLDDSNLVVFGPGRRAYHVELSGICLGLRGGISIALSSRTDRMCGFAGDAITVNGGFRERCPVLGVRELDDDQLQILVDQFDGVEGQDAVEVRIPPAED